MKAGKAPCPSGIVMEMIRAAGDTGPPWSVTSQLQSFAVARYPLTGSRVSSSASTRVRGFIGKGKLPRSQADRAGHESPREDCGRSHQTVVSIDNSQFGFDPGRGTTDAIFVVRQLQEKYLAANKRLHGFCRPGEAFDWVPRKVIWWARRKLGVEEWIVRLVQGSVPMHGAVSVLVRGTVKSLRVWSEGGCSTLNPCHANSALESPGMTSISMTLLSSLNHSRYVSGGSWLGKKQRRKQD